MHLLLVDHLTCPRCGPEFGLILMADGVSDRRVQSGSLGCFNCRERYPVANGQAHLLPPGEVQGEEGSGDGLAGPEGARGDGATAGEPREAGDAEAAFRVAALLGIRKGPGHVLVAGEAARHARAVARLVEELEVVVLNREGGAAGGDEEAGADGGGAAADGDAGNDGAAGPPSRSGRTDLVVGSALPVRSHALMGAFLDAPWSTSHLEEALRVVRPGARIVLRDAPQETREALESRGLELLLATDRTLVAVR